MFFFLLQSFLFFPSKKKSKYQSGSSWSVLDFFRLDFLDRKVFRFYLFQNFVWLEIERETVTMHNHIVFNLNGNENLFFWEYVFIIYSVHSFPPKSYPSGSFPSRSCPSGSCLGGTCSRIDICHLGKDFMRPLFGH